MDLSLRPRDDLDSLRDTYARDGVVRIDDLFSEETAQAIRDVLQQQTRWHLVHSDQDGRHVIRTPETWTGLDGAARNRIIKDVLTRARDSFSYIYSVYPMIDRYIDGSDPDWPLHRLTEYLNSPPVLDMVRYVTNEPEGRKLDAQATFYAPGHFLNEHDDRANNPERRAAYVIGFTRDWRYSWGGQLLFTQEGRIVDGFSPSFNTMTLFKVPRAHLVTQVSNFAGGERFSVTGWLRVD